MAHGLRIFRNDGREILNTTDIGSLVIDVVVAPTGSGNVTTSYPTLTGLNVAPVSYDPQGSSGVTITYPGGVPTVSVARSSSYERRIPVVVD